MRAKPRHDQVRRSVENHIADVEQGQAGRYLLRTEMQLGGQIMTLFLVHSLREADVRSDGGA